MRWRGLQDILLRSPVTWLALGAVAARLVGMPLWDPPAPDARRVEVTEAFVDGLAWLQGERTGHTPDAAERVALAQGYAEEEVLFREALALGLERGDTIIRRRLVQKMRFLVEDATPLGDPTPEALARVVTENPRAFQGEVAARFVQVVLPADASTEEVQAVLRSARAGAPEDAAGLGVALPTPDPEGALPVSVIARRYGAEVAVAAEAGPVGEWQDPLRGPHGWHLLHVLERHEAPAPDLADPRVAKKAEALWREGRRGAVNREAIQRLMARYQVVLPGPAAVATAEVSR
ncbi:MAG: peptidyl-prolyl cis-trans isomerase [Myxococcales bacterium]|nr:peptidyl-prolyl cis-trans isomerase [Myxococcales bacterium]MCB9646938.1 peptidyl-prolyl cis-trans isomerase [Deltaproteobacteria bacterium]